VKYFVSIGTIGKTAGCILGRKGHMEVHQLRYFCAVARTENFTRAAESERVAQPSLSQQILKLESELGARLFDRLPRSARLTSFGRAFLPKALAILQQISDARDHIHEMQGSEKGHIVVGAIPTIAPYLLPDILAAFSSSHPAISFNVVEDITPVLLEKIRDARVDFAILALPAPGEELECMELLRESLFAALPAKHPLARRASIKLEQLKGEPFLLLKEGHCFRENTLAACRRSRITPNVAFESGQFNTILAMVCAGMGVSVIPRMALQEHSGCVFVEIADPKSMRKVGAARLKNHYLGRAQTAFWNYLRQTFAKKDVKLAPIAARANRIAS
jgi:LysR family transcriptional regulator, hydrogen peroxide-inducible genes activator